MGTRTHTTRKSSAPASADKSPASVPVAPSHDDAPAPDIATQLAAAARGHSLASIAVTPAPLGAIQPKLTVGAPDDAYEREADRTASQVMRMPDSDVQRATPEDDEDKIQAKPDLQRKADGSFEAGAAAESRIAARRGGGSPLPEATRAFMEPRFGADFGGVRVHADAEADGISQDLSARAFTTGSDIYFRQGEYSPSSSGGQELLAHELTHVVQQEQESIHQERAQVQRKNGGNKTNNKKPKKKPSTNKPKLIDPVERTQTRIAAIESLRTEWKESKLEAIRVDTLCDDALAKIDDVDLDEVETQLATAYRDQMRPPLADWKHYLGVGAALFPPSARMFDIYHIHVSVFPDAFKRPPSMAEELRDTAILDKLVRVDDQDMRVHATLEYPNANGQRWEKASLYYGDTNWKKGTYPYADKAAQNKCRNELDGALTDFTKVLTTKIKGARARAGLIQGRVYVAGDENL